MARRTKLLNDLTTADLWKEVKDPLTLWGDRSVEAQRTLTRLLTCSTHDASCDRITSAVMHHLNAQ